MRPLRLAVMTIDDLNPVLTMETLSFKRPWTRESFLSELACEHARNFTVRCQASGYGETIVGYTCFRVVMDEMHLMRLVVHPENRNRGIGTWLMHETLELAENRGATTAFLEVRRSNTKAVSLYQKHGFKIICARTAYYEDNEDALIMMKSQKTESGTAS